MPVIAPKLTEPGDSPVNKELLENPKQTVRKKRRGKAKWKKSEPPYRIYKLVDRHVDEKGRVHYRANFINYDASHDVWYYEEDLLETCPELIKDYLQRFPLQP